ncbi:hypothetical protein MGH68_11145 [Erysipelothrix sp. D19-032]
MKNRYDSERTVQDIINVSIKSFSEKGYEKTSIQDIVNGLDGRHEGPFTTILTVKMTF